MCRGMSKSSENPSLILEFAIFGQRAFRTVPYFSRNQLPCNDRKNKSKKNKNNSTGSNNNIYLLHRNRISVL